MKNLSCSFIGHRKINLTDALSGRVKAVVEELIVKKGVTVFLFGSRSEFNRLCHEIVTKLKEKYPQVKRVAYTCKSEACVLESERLKVQKLKSRFAKDDEPVLGYEEEFEHKTKYTSGKACYVERNQAMIDDSDYCVFYYDENYFPNRQSSLSQKAVSLRGSSGTRLAYDYALQKKKTLLNLFP